MSRYKVAVVVGSLRKESINKKLAQALIKLGAERLDAALLPLDDVPLYNQDVEEAGFPPGAQSFKDGIKAAHGILVVTPEYNRSIPGVLKNAIDWASRPYGQAAWSGKAVGVIGTSTSALATAGAQFATRHTFACLDARVMNLPEAYVRWTDGLVDEGSEVTDEKTKTFLAGYVKKFAAWIEHHEKAPGFNGEA